MDPLTYEFLLIAGNADDLTSPQQPELPAEFKRKLESWERIRRSGGGGVASPKSDSDWGLEFAPSSASGMPKPKKKSIRARPAPRQRQLEEGDLKPEFRLKVAEWEVRKAMAGHSSKKVEEITR